MLLRTTGCLRRFVLANHVQEEPVDAQIGGQLWMESCCEQVAAADQSGEAFAGGQRLDARPGRPNARRADEDHLQWAAWK